MITSRELLSSTVPIYDKQCEPLSNILFNADGKLKRANTQNYFYLFVPLYYRVREPNLNNSLAMPTITNNSNFVNINIEEYYQTGEYEYFGWEGYGVQTWVTEYYGVIIYKVSVKEANNSPSSRQTVINVTSMYGEAEDIIGSTPTHAASTVEYTAQFTIVQDGKEDTPDPSIGAHIYYGTFLSSDDIEDEKAKTIYNLLYIENYPFILHDIYSYLASSDDSTHSFDYLNIKVDNASDAVFTSSSDVSWAELLNIWVDSKGKHYIYKILVEENGSTKSRSAILELKLKEQTAIKIFIKLYGTDSGEDPEVPDIPDEVEEHEYWEGGSSVSIIDTNQGAAIDSTSLLFKSNFSNYYSTIELKDGTLFLGNYTSNKQINNVHEVMNHFVGTSEIVDEECRKKVYIETLDSLGYSYTYVPNMKLNSQQKRLFKAGETYALGLVFVDKTGTWSSVYYLGDELGKWTVSTNLEPHLILDTNTQYYNKPVKCILLSEQVVEALSELGIIAVIPVYAVKVSNTIMCLGFLSPSIQSTSRQEVESIDSLYSWFYRDKFTLLPTLLPAGVDAVIGSVEILNLKANRNSDYPSNWNINRQICTLNTPEVECDEHLSNAMLLNVSCKSIWNYSGFSYSNNITLQVSGKYIYSYFSAAHAYTDLNDNEIPVTSIKDWRYITGYIWKGFLDNLFLQDNGDLLNESRNRDNYKWYAVYPWLRSTIGGEGPTSAITSKVLFNSLYNDGLTVNSDNLTLNIPSGLIEAAIYRDFDTATIIKVGTNIYQGNVDYIAITEAADAYKAWTSAVGIFPRAHTGTGVYAGYDENGNITDPISIKYKTAPHIVLNFNGNVTYDDATNALFCVELYNSDITLKTDTQDLLGYQWIKCGDIKRIMPTERTLIFYEEGDYFFGRYDSLRTYRYAENDVNSVVEVVSGMLCSKVNLDSRCDRNRGVTTPTISPTNFNIFNPVYNQLNNYFTFSYVNLDDLIYKRLYSNSIQWSLTKEYSSDIDNWCNILDINTLDFDGDKGQIRSIERLGNELIVFQDTAISLIQYNEKTQIATEQGIPIEIGNSGKVDGKHYLYDHVGCQYKGSISKSPNGIYFVDSINKSLYQLGVNAKLTDLCTTIGMKSWGISNIDSSWWSYYDTNSQEVIFSNNVESLAFSDAYGKFNSFVGYGRIRWNFRGNDLTIQICPINFKQVISTTTPTLSSNKRIPCITKELHNDSVTFWKKNSIDETKFFGNYSPVEILLQCNPEPTIDKIFSTVEYRMDCFDELNNYLENVTFDSFRAWNEYQDTALINLNYLEGNEDGPIYNRIYSTKLRKKFRIWRLDIPRASYKSISLLEGNNAVVSNESLTYNPDTGISIKTKNQPRDRIRNPWCNIYLSMDTSKANKIIFNDLAVQYFK